MAALTALRSKVAQPSEARVLARSTAVIAVVCGLTAIYPFSDTAPRGLAAVLAVIGLVLSWALRRLADRLTVAVVHGLLVVVTALMTLCVAVATRPDGAVVTAVTFLWVAIYSAAFHSRAALLAHLCLIGAGMGFGLWASAPPSAPQTWIFLMGTIAGVALILNDKVIGLREDATRDALTGALTRRAFFDAAEREMAWAARTRQSLTVALIDLDDFKGVNDRHGHGAGDAVLAGLPRAWAPHLRPRDLVGRLGGDEFAILLPGSSEDDAAAVLQRLHGATRDITFSAGTAPWRGDPLDLWLAAADAALYRSKGPGRTPPRRERGDAGGPLPGASATRAADERGG